MRKGIMLLLACLLMASVSATANVSGGKPGKLLKKFASRVEMHDVKGMLALVDGSYKQVQLIGMHKNDTTRFINELMCGNNTADNVFSCVKLNDIKSCDLMKVGKFDSDTNSPAYASVTYKVETYDGKKIKVSLVVVRITTSTGTLFRIAGAVG